MKLSIIIPVYNPSESQLEQCLESVINQKDCAIEIILIDNASIAKCPEIMKKYSTKYSQIKLIVLSKNIGPAGAVNIGLQYVTGDYFIIVDADDFLIEDASKRLSEIVVANNSDIIIFSHKILIESKQTFESYVPLSELDESVFNRALTSKEVLKILPKISLTWWNKCYKTAYIKNLNLQLDKRLKYVLCDVLFSIQSVCLAKTITITRTQLYVYRINNLNTNILQSFASNKCRYWYAPVIFAQELCLFLRKYNIKNENCISIYYILLLHLYLSSNFSKLQILRTIKIFYSYKLFFWLNKFPIKLLKKEYPNKLLYKWFFIVKYMPLLFYFTSYKKGEY